MRKHLLIDLLEPYLSLQESYKFSEWAFGKDYLDEVTALSLKSKWNSNHRDKLDLQDDGIIWNDIMDMITIWKENTLNK